MLDKLQELSEIAPDVCRARKSDNIDYFFIGEYEFWFSDDGNLLAAYEHIATGGRPALAWLRDALEAAIEARGWYFETHYRPQTKTYRVEVANRVSREYTPAAALLAALCAALKKEA